MSRDGPTEGCRFDEIVLCALPGVALALGIMAAYSGQHMTNLMGGTLFDTDSFLRVARLREILDTGSWQAGLVARDNAPDGFYMHWTKPFDVLILGLAWLPAQFFGFDAALPLVAGLISVINLVILVAAGAWAVRPLAGSIGSSVSGVLVGTALPLQSYGLVGRADHHIMAVLLCVWFLGLTIRLARGGGPGTSILAGCVLSVSLWVTVETVPALLFCCGILALARLGGGMRARIDLLGVTATIVIGAAVFLDPPAAGARVAEIDRISVVYLSMVAFLAIGLMGCELSARYASRGAHWGVALICLGVSFLAWLCCFPELLKGPEAFLGEDLTRIWWEKIKELRPAVSARDIALFAGTGVMGAVAPWVLAVRERRRPEALLYAALAVLTAIFVAMTIKHIRFAPYAAAFGAIGLGIVVGRMSELSRRPLKDQGVAIVAIALACIMAPMVAAILAKGEAEEPAGLLAVGQAYRCEIRSVAAALDDPIFMRVARPIALSEIGAAPELLYWTQRVRTIAGPYQRNVEGLRDFYGFLRSEAEAERIARRRGITHVLLCPGGTAFQEDYAFGQAILANQLPSWLHPVTWPTGVSTDLKLYEVYPR